MWFMNLEHNLNDTNGTHVYLENGSGSYRVKVSITGVSHFQWDDPEYPCYVLGSEGDISVVEKSPYLQWFLDINGGDWYKDHKHYRIVCLNFAVDFICADSASISIEEMDIKN